jgi:hypothetical protein
MYIGLQAKYHYYCVIFNETRILSADLKKKFMKRCQVGAESFQADRHDAGNSRFSELYECTYYQINFD